MNFSTPFYSETSWSPLLFLHGLGSKASLDPTLETILTDLGYSVSSLLRDDQSILTQSNPYEIYREETSDMIRRLEEKTSEKVTLVGNSLGSYIALLTAFQVSDNVRAVLWLDAFLTPRYGFAQMQKISLEWENQLQWVYLNCLSSFWKSYKEQVEKKKEWNFVVPLVDGFIELPYNLSDILPDIGEIIWSQNVNFPVALVYASGDTFISPSKAPHTLIAGKNITHFEIGCVKDEKWNERKAEHNDWKKSPEAIAFAKKFLK